MYIGEKGSMAQLVAQFPHKEEVAGSFPVGSTHGDYSVMVAR